MQQELIRYLRKDQIKNINLINFIKRYPIECFKKVSQSVLVRGKSDENWVYISSSSKKELYQLVTQLKKDDHYFAIIEDWMLPFLG